MPWTDKLLFAAAVVAGFTTILVGIAALWKKVLRPAAKLINTADEMLPLLKDLTDVFKDTPHAFQILEQIIGQFRTDSGSSLRDVVNRLETFAKESLEVADKLKAGVEEDRIGAEAQRRLAETDRAQVQRLILVVDRLAVKLEAAESTRDYGNKMLEKIAAVIAVTPTAASPDQGIQAGESVVITRQDK